MTTKMTLCGGVSVTSLSFRNPLGESDENIEEHSVDNELQTFFKGIEYD